MNNSPILIVGSTGKTGRRIVQLLSQEGHTVRLGSRQSETPFDWQKPQTWSPALQGVRAVYVSFFPDLAVASAPAAIEEFSSLARKAAVQRIVLLSGRGETNAQRCESIVRECGVDFTLIRTSWFSQNFSENFLLDPVMSGTVALPIEDVKEPFVDVDDIAEVAVAALTQDGHKNRLYELTGPRLMSFANAIDSIAKAADRPIKFQTITKEEYAKGLEQHELPEELSSLIMYLFTTVLDGRNAYLADGVQEALGREPRDFSRYARETAATGIWARQA